VNPAWPPLHDGPFRVGSNAAGDDQSNASGPLGVENAHFFEAILRLFQAGVHGAHQGAVLQAGKPEVQGFKQMRVLADAGCRCAHSVLQIHDGGW